MKKKVVAVLTVLSMILAFSVTAFAENSQISNEIEEDLSIENADISVEMSEENIYGDVVDISISEEVINSIEGNQIEEILCEGLGTMSDEIQIVSDTELRDKEITLDPDGAYYVENEKGELVGVTVDEQISNKDTGIAYDLVNDSARVGEGDVLNIIEIGDCSYEDDEGLAENQREKYISDDAIDNQTDIYIDPELSNGVNQHDSSDVSTEGILYKIVTGKAEKKGKQYVGSDKFVTSVAKGQTITLKERISKSVSTSIKAGASIDVAEMKAGLNATITASYEVGQKFSSSDMDKGCNSREFRVKFYKQDYTRTQKKVNRITNKKVDSTTATISKPTKYASYSIDKKVTK